MRVTRKKETEQTKWDKMERELEREGVVPFENTSIKQDYLKLPPFLDELPSHELGRYLNAFTMQRMYVRSSISKLGAMLQEIEILLNAEKSRVFATLPVKMSVKEKELNLYSDEVAKGILETYTYYQNKYKYYLDYMESLDDAKFSLSREISRRGMDFMDNSRGENLR